MYINTYDNVADLMTKNLPSGEKRTKFCKMLLHYLTPSIKVKTSNKPAAGAAVRVFQGSGLRQSLKLLNAGMQKAGMKSNHLNLFYVLL